MMIPEVYPAFQELRKPGRSQLLSYYNLVFTLKPLCIKHCILRTFPNSVEINPKIYHSSRIQVGELCIARADVISLDHRASPVARGERVKNKL